ncbi:MAG: hypothetical protein JWO96_754 [Candidatus Saccharibacteria bacterium]|nr:hypothetical protein [Candidatus Saccharibacteria bacterium]
MFKENLPDIPSKPRRAGKVRMLGVGLTAAGVAATGVGAGNAAAANHPPKPKNTSAEIAKLRHQLDLKQRQIDAQTAQLNHISNIASHLIGMPKKELYIPDLVKVNQLPGFNQLITPEVQSELISSSVRIMRRPKGSNEAWTDHCTGTVVDIPLEGRASPVLTAEHCVQDDQSVDYSTYDGFPAQNITAQTKYEYMISKDNSQVPIATVEDIVIAMPGHGDFSLMWVKPIEGLEGSKIESYNSIPPLKPASTTHNFEPGAQAAMLGYTQVSGYRPVAGIGRFLGTFDFDMTKSGDTQPYYAIAFEARQPKAIPCNSNGSGSSAIMPDRTLTGPLVSRASIGNINGIPNPGDNISASAKWRIKEIEKKFGIDESAYSDVCFYGVPESVANNFDTYGILKEGLHHIPPYRPALKGGPDMDYPPGMGK